MSRIPIPAIPDDLTPDWLTTVLREAGVLDEATVTSLSTTIIGQEYGFTGIVTRVTPEYDRVEPDAPASIVAKFPNAAGESLSAYRETVQRDPVGARRYYERCAREIWFYQQIKPLSAVLAPEMYYGAADLDEGRFVLLLQDLGAMRMGDALTGCPASDAGAVLRAAGTLHAGWWRDPRLDTFSWLTDWAGDLDARHERYNRGVEPFLKRWRDRLPAEIRQLVLNLRPVYREVVAELVEAPETLIHTDLHLDNIAFDGSNAATVIDWQGISRGPAAIDLAAFLSASLDSDTRRATESNLLRVYHELLIAHGVTDYSHDQLWRDYRLALLCILANIVNWLGSVNLDNLAGRELALTRAFIDDDWFFSTVMDNRAGELLAR